MHNHRKGEMEHHKERHKHKSAHHAKKDKHSGSYCDHNKKNNKIAVSPVKFRHEAKIHSVNAAYQRKRHHYGGDNSQHFHDLIQLIGGCGHIAVQGAG